MAAGSGDVKESELICTFVIITRGKLHRVAGIAQILEMNAFDHASVVHIQAWNHSYRQ